MKNNYLKKIWNLFLLLVLMVTIVSLILLFNYLLASFTGSVGFYLLPSGAEGLILFSLVPVKPGSRLTKSEREKFVLTPKLKEILIGLLLGDLSARRPKPTVNTRLLFAQGIIHKDYLLHLYELFKDLCKAAPVIVTPMAHKQTEKVYPYIRFEARTLPCFNYYYDIFYLNGNKTVPSNIGDLLTPLGLCYWIADDGCFHIRDFDIYLCTNGFSLEGINLLINALKNKFNLECTVVSQKNGFMIRISRKSLPTVQALLKDIMPPMMKYKIGL